MPRLVVTEPAGGAATAAVEKAITSPVFAKQPALRAGLSLYVDDLERSHVISQSIHDPIGAFWHGIMHRREGDFANSHYWFRQLGTHPAMDSLTDYDPHTFIDEVEARYRLNPAELVDIQRAEWQALFTWCANKA